MTTAHDLAQQFLDALASNSTTALEAVLAEDAGLRLLRWDGLEAYRPRPKVTARLQTEWSSWPDASLQCLSVLAEGERAAVQFRIQATDPASGRYLEHFRSAFLTVVEGQVALIDLYCAEPVPSAHRRDWIAPATLTDDQLNRVLEQAQSGFDPWQQLPPKIESQFSLRRGRDLSGVAHPGSNFVGGIRWTAAEADAQIAALIDVFRQRGLGFSWWVGPHDTPVDLGQRLATHGLVLAGHASTMVRRGLDQLNDIPLNPAVEVVPADVLNDAHLEAVLRIGAASFNWAEEQLPEWRANLQAMARNPYFKDKDFPYLAYLNGEAVGFGRISLRAGLAYLSGAATLPQARGQRIYSSLLRRRLEAARARGYQVAAIQAEPMSRRIVVRYGFSECAKVALYAWMPVIDLAVIKSLVPDD